MAKGQKRSSKEPRKPKQATPKAAVVTTTFLGMAQRKV
jgi:hypothetical protein